MIKILYACIDPRHEAPRFLEYLNQVPREIQEKVRGFHRWQDAHASLFGKLLLKKGLEEEDSGLCLTDIKYSPYGRPYMKGPIDFNISHAGSYVVCALASPGRIGADLEKVKPLALLDFKNQFTSKEWGKLTNAEDPYTGFYAYWTAKEAVVKAEGKGLHIPFNSISVADHKTLLGENTWYTYKINFMPDYMLHIASDIKIRGSVSLKQVLF
jgi:4'-phosphopantetheinyl transferase